MQRRDVLKAVGATVLATVAANGARAAALPFFARHRLPIGLQLYTLKPDLEKDLGGTLRRVSALGYRRVEMAGFLGLSAADLRRAFDRSHLECRSAHVPGHASGAEPTLAGDIGTLAEAMHVIGVETVVLPTFLPPVGMQTDGVESRFVRGGNSMTADDWKRNADFLNEKARLLRRHGFAMQYHNHNFEFRPLDGGTTGFEILMKNTDPALVAFEMDAGWVCAAGHDPIELLGTYPGRFRQMHVKDIKSSTVTNYSFQQDPTEVGSGKIDWAHILPAAYAAGVRGFQVEQEPPFPGPRLDSVARSFRYLSTLRTA